MAQSAMYAPPADNGSGAPGGAPVATRGRGIAMSNESDVNHDGYPDLVLYFRTQQMKALQGLESQAAGHRPALQQAEAVLYGTTYSGQRIRGSGTVRIVPPANASPAASPNVAPPHRGPQRTQPSHSDLRAPEPDSGRLNMPVTVKDWLVPT